MDPTVLPLNQSSISSVSIKPTQSWEDRRKKAFLSTAKRASIFGWFWLEVLASNAAYKLV